MPTSFTKKHLYIILTILIVTLLTAIIIMLNPFSSLKEKYQAAMTSGSRERKQQTTPTSSPSPSPSPMYLAPGKQTYHISHGDKVTGPKPSKLVIDPINPTPDQKTTITVDISSNSDITKAQIILVTDNDSQTLDLKLIQGDKQTGIWQTTAKIKDTYLYKYLLNFNLQSSTGTYTGGLTFRQ